MHELSVAQSIVDIIHQYVPVDDRPRVRTVQIKIGAMAGVVVESLAFCFEAVTAKTLLASAKLAIDIVPFSIKCRKCGNTTFSEEGIVLCATCGSGDTEVLGGTEMQVTTIAVDDPVPEEP